LTGWPTASARDWKNGKASQQTLDRNARPLSEIVRLAGWGTARNVKEGHSSGNPQRADDGMGRLEDQVYGLAGWASPNTPSGGPNYKQTDTHRGGLDLDGQVLLSGYHTPRTNDAEKRGQIAQDPRNGLPGQVIGMTIPPSPASTDTHAGSLSLNPEFTRWLMGYPDAW
jgi:hypothetical protein